MRSVYFICIFILFSYILEKFYRDISCNNKNNRVNDIKADIFYTQLYFICHIIQF